MKKIILFSLGLAVIISCSKRFDDMNVSPNSPKDVPSQMLLASAMVRIPYALELSSSTNITDLWVQYTKATTYVDEDQYKPRNDRMNTVWSSLYNQSFEDCTLAIEKARADGLPNNEAVGLILKAYVGYHLTMLFGDVPYSKACQASQGSLSPSYDTQLNVLNSILTDLTSASDLIGTSTEPLPLEKLAAYDYVYGGDLQLWKKFANTLKLRVYLTLTTGGDNKTPEINALLASPDIFQSSDEEALLPYLTSDNPVYQWINPGSSRRNDFRITNTLVEYMRGSSLDSTLPADARLTIYAFPLKTGVDSAKYVGGRNGIKSGISTCSKIGSYYTSSTPYYFMTYTEVLFIKAEMDTTNAANYQAAVTASFIHNGLTSAAANGMLADPNFAFNAAKGGQLIGEQKWVALFGDGNEAFNSWRRTGYPKLIPAANAATVQGFVPRRIAYNTDEKNLNTANVNAAIATLYPLPGEDVVSSRVWFDRNHPTNFGNK